MIDSFSKICMLISIFKKTAGDVIHTIMSHSGADLDYSTWDGTCLLEVFANMMECCVALEDD